MFAVNLIKIVYKIMFANVFKLVQLLLLSECLLNLFAIFVNFKQ